LPGGLADADDGGVHRPSLPFSLDQADDTASLPRLGGMARPDGVVIVSERFWAFAGTDGSLRTGEMPSPLRTLRHVPLVRGLVRLGASLSPLSRRSGVAKPRERWLLLLAVLSPFLFVFLPQRASLFAGIAVTVGLVAWMLRGRTLNLHGAEHRAIAAAEARTLGSTWRGDARPSRSSCPSRSPSTGCGCCRRSSSPPSQSRSSRSR
jgi:hypothetical protein